jgi:putative inorganic carbon (HCO3(-)) transporter
LAGLLVVLLLVGAVLVARQRILLQATSTSYTPLSGEARWEGDWELSEQGADPSEAGSLAGTDRAVIPFSGTDLALTVRRGSYRAYFWISVDGKPANRLPREERNKQRDAYLVLSSPDYEPQVVTLPVTGGLSDGPHEAVVVADRGWDQWPLVGWRVGRTPDTAAYDWALAGLGVVGLASLVGTIWQRGKRQSSCSDWSTFNNENIPPPLRASCAPPPAEGGEQLVPPPVVGEARWGGQRSLFSEQRDREAEWSGLQLVIFGLRFTISDSVSLPLVLVATIALYFSPWFFLKVVSGLALAVLVFMRLDLGLALIAAMAPFYLKPVALLGKSFSLVEIVTLLCVASWGIRCAWQWRKSERQGRLASCVLRLTSLDLAALTFVLVALASFFVAEYRHVALRELRVLILEPALFYLMLRTSRLDGKAIWRVVHFFVLGAVIVALLGLVQYAFSDVAAVRQALGDVIRAEGGFHRLRSVYGSPNSVGLYLGRVLPILVAVALFGASRNRRIVYGLAAVPVGLAILLSFSKGALLVGVPLSLLVLGVLAGGRWLWASLGAIALGIVAAIPLLRTPRFASLFDPSRGTLFFRLHLWRSSWTMFREHPLLGVGPDNFLYQYRGRYILPAAWEEPHLSQAHNILLDYATRMGVAGLAVGAWLQVAFWRAALPLRRLTDPDRRALALGLMGSMVSFLAHGLVDASYFLIDLAFAFFLALGVVQWLSRSETHGNEN